jgi:hypothetical protein
VADTTLLAGSRQEYERRYFFCCRQDILQECVLSRQRVAQELLFTRAFWTLVRLCFDLGLCLLSVTYVTLII